MTIIKKKLSEFIVNANNFTRTADEYIKDLTKIKGTVEDGSEQMLRLNTLIWNGFEDGLFLPESDFRSSMKKEGGSKNEDRNHEGLD